MYKMMHEGICFLLLVSTRWAQAAQPTAPRALAAPLRDLQFGQLNFLHTTDTHGWHAGHLLEPSYGADWGDYIDFAGRLREKVEADGRDLLIIDTGDRIEGNGLYDASEPKGIYTFPIFDQQHIDLICSGNHELYKQNSSENEYLVTVPAYRDNYLASNLDILDPNTQDFVPLAARYKKFKTKKQGIQVMAFGFLYNFAGNANNTIVQPVEKTIKEAWFQEAIRDRDVDMFLVIGHAAVRSEEFDSIFKAIRSVQWDVPIQFFGGHFHIRDYRKFDAKSYGLASGRFMETIGFQSIDGISTKGGESTEGTLTFFRRYIDNNLYSFYHHSGHNSTSFHSELGQNVSKTIAESRTALKLDETFGCTDDNLWMSRAAYPSNSSIFTWLDERVIPDMVTDPSRADSPRIVITNTGAIRFDIFKGAFTKDSTYIICPFTSGFHYIREVPFDKASKVLALLNSNGIPFEQSNENLQSWRLAPLEQLGVGKSALQQELSQQNQQSSQYYLYDGKPDLTPGYTTKDDAGDNGDDTIHSPITFYRVPNCIQSIINPDDMIELESDTKVDLIFNEFIQPWVILALRFLGLEYSDKEVDVYMPGETLTSVIAKWVSLNWAKNC